MNGMDCKGSDFLGGTQKKRHLRDEDNAIFQLTLKPRIFKNWFNFFEVALL